MAAGTQPPEGCLTAFRRARLVTLVPVLISALLGLGLPLVASRSSLEGTPHRSSSTSALPSPGGRPSGISAGAVFVPTVEPSPPVGLLGTRPWAHFLVDGSLLVGDDQRQMLSGDGGSTWSAIRPPPGTTKVVIDEAAPSRWLAAGDRVLFSQDGGRTWAAPRFAPPGPGPYEPLLISPADPTVWFLLHQGRLLRTRDGGVSWRDLDGLPPMTGSLLVSGDASGQFFVAVGGAAFQLDDNGQRIYGLGSLPQGATVSRLAAGGEPPMLLARASDGRSYLNAGGGWRMAGTRLSGPPAVVAGVLLVGGGAALGPAAVDYSADRGGTWQAAIGLPDRQNVLSIGGRRGSAQAIAYCSGGDLYISVDAGRSWRLLSTSLRAG